MSYCNVLKWWLAVFLVLVSFPLIAEKSSITFGSVAMDVPSVMHRRLTPLTKYLSEKLGQPVSLKLAKDMPEAIGDLSTGSVDLAYLTPVAYIRSNEVGNTHLDIAGRSFAFGDKAALLQRAVVAGAGMPLEKLGSYEFLKHYDNIVRAVLLGEFDAGILKDTKAYKWQDKGIRIIYSSPDLPPYNIAASANTSPEMRAVLKKAFLDLDISNPEHQSIIRALDKKYDGFAKAEDADYDIVRKLVKPFSQK